MTASTALSTPARGGQTAQVPQSAVLHFCNNLHSPLTPSQTESQSDTHAVPATACLECQSLDVNTQNVTDSCSNLSPLSPPCSRLVPPAIHTYDNESTVSTPPCPHVSCDTSTSTSLFTNTSTTIDLSSVRVSSHKERLPTPGDNPIGELDQAVIVAACKYESSTTCAVIGISSSFSSLAISRDQQTACVAESHTAIRSYMLPIAPQPHRDLV